MIRLLKRSEIDEEQWNACVSGASARFPYACTWYLDCVAENWEGLATDDYSAVFPLTWGKKFFIPYLFQPMFAQQLGVFSNKPLDEAALNAFLDAIPSRFRFIEINMNYLNPVKHSRFEVIPRTNLFLELQASYEQLFRQYQENTARNIHKAQKNNLLISEDVSAETIIDFFKTNTGIKIPELGEYHYARLAALIGALRQRGMGKLLGVTDTSGNLFASGFFILAENKIINLLPSTGEDGKNNGAGFLLIDHLIKTFAGSGKTLDFEGSMIPGIARFYKSFGAQEQTYWRLRRNNLPWFAKWVKG